MRKYELMPYFVANGDGSFTEVKATVTNDKAKELKEKFGDLATDVVDEVLWAIKHEDNRMYYEIKFWNEVKTNLNTTN